MYSIRYAVLAAVLVAGTTLQAQAAAKKVTEPAFTHADVHFLQDMMHHHAQALEICELAAGRAGAAVSTLCNRVLVSQRDEIEVMSNWLKARGQEAPEVMGHHHGALEALEHSSMPGMLTPAQLRELANASGAEFDRLFLTGMIRHHEGAVTMVKKLFETSGAGQGSELFTIATNVDADQRAEISRMQGMLKKQ